MRRIVTYIFAAAFVLLPFFSARAEEPKKSPYEKFISKKGLQKAEGFATIYRDKGDIWLEIPDSLVGRDMMLSSYTLSSTCPYYPNWKELSKKPVYRIAATDSLLLLQKPGLPYSTLPEATLFSLPIKYRGADGHSFVVKATKLFDLSSKDVISYVSKSYKSAFDNVSNQEYKSDISRIKRLMASGGYVGIERDATFSLSISAMGFEAGKENLSADVVTTLSLLPNAALPSKEVDSRIGTRAISCQVFDEEKGLDEKTFVSSWNLDEKITVYVDTLIAPSFRKAVAEGLGAWNEAFTEAGLGEKIEVKDLSDDIDVFCQMTNVVMSCGSTSSEPFAVINTAPDGRILSFRIGVPDGFINNVRRQGMLSIADVDSRFAQYNVPEDALCEVMRAKMMTLMGLCLGLERNYAGSYAYSPEELRDPSFTAQNGITASVTDDVLFNVLAAPGDKERGVKVISDKIGSYDKYAIAWMYADGKPDNLPEHLFIGLERPQTDYRGLEGDLGNDLFAYVSAAKSHLEYAADHLADWITQDDEDGERRQLQVDYVWLKYTELVRLYQKLLGAMKLSEIREGEDVPYMQPLDKDIQKKALEHLFTEFADVSFIDGNKKLMEMSGMNRNVSAFTNAYVFTYGNTASRLSNVAYAYDMAGSDYSPQEFLSDVQGYMLANVSKGRLNSLEEVSIDAYLSFLIANCGITKANYDDAIKKNSASLSELRPYLSKTISYHSSEYDIMCLRSLQEAEKLLKKGYAAAKDAEVKGKIAYLLSVAESALGD